MEVSTGPCSLVHGRLLFKLILTLVLDVIQIN